MRSYGISRAAVPSCLHIPLTRTSSTPSSPGNNHKSGSHAIQNSSKYTSLARTLSPDNKREGYDVYVYEPERLEEGVRKHVISLFVADESGLINRVAGVFARRGANIESLAVGLTKDKALFTIVATGTDATVSNLSKQLAKLVHVRYVEDITDQKYIQREFMLIKIKAPAGPARTEITQLAQIFRAHIVDVGDETFSMTVTGDPGKMAAFIQVLSNFGIIELVRTGRIALKRGDSIFAGSADGDTIATPGSMADGNGSTHSTGVRNLTKLKSSAYGGESDVYGSDDDESEGVWNVHNILDATYNDQNLGFDPYTISLDVQDVPGVLNQVTGVISRRGFNVQSLAVGNSEKDGMSRITLVIPGNANSILNLKKQLLKLVYVESATVLNTIPHVARELMLIKVQSLPSQRGELNDIAEIFHGIVCDISRTTLTFEFTGKEDKMMAIQDVLAPYGIMEIARTGSVALARESGVDTRYLNKVAGSRVML